MRTNLSRLIALFKLRKPEVSSCSYQKPLKFIIEMRTKEQKNNKIKPQQINKQKPKEIFPKHIYPIGMITDE